MNTSPPVERSLASLQRISGAGRSAEVFAWDERTVLKLARGPEFNAGFEREALALEAAAAVPGLAPRLVGVITIEGRTGLLLERITGIDLLKEVERKPWRIWRIGRELAEVHARLSSLAVPEGLPGARQAIEHVLASPLVPEGHRAVALSLLASLPEGKALCHQDFHPGNLMRGSHGELKVIDFANACSGDPDWDFAVTRSLIEMGELPPETPGWLRLAARFARRLLRTGYSRRYRRLRAVDETNVEKWATVFFVQRLGDDIPEERERLLRLIGQRTAEGA